MLPITETAKAEMERIVAQFKLDTAWPDDVYPEVAHILNNLGLDDPDLSDLRHLPFVTIDGDGTRDLDQALFIDRFHGGYRLFYAIADAAFYVQPGTALFENARLRGASYYLPGLSVPMLPRELSEGVISLNAQTDRRAVIFTFVVNATGHCTQTQVTKGKIHSRAALTFDQVQQFYDDPQKSPLSETPFAESLGLLRELGRLRLAEARQRDVVIYQRATLGIVVGETGYGFNLTADVRTEVEMYNEQISLLCNIEGARHIQAHGAVAAWRVHPNPPDDRLAHLARLIAGIAKEHQLDLDIWRWRRRKTPADSQGEPLADYLERIANHAAAATDDVTPRIRRVIERTAMVSNVRSGFSKTPGEHSGIGAPLYARLTAPMRELVGIHTHAVTLSATGLPSWDPQTTASLLEEVIDSANRARETQRQITKAANKLVIDRLLQKDFDTPYPERPFRRGTILELRTNRVYVLLDDPPIEIKLYHDDIGLCRDIFGSGAVITLVSGKRLSMGGLIDVRVRGYNPQRDRWYFEFETIPKKGKRK